MKLRQIKQHGAAGRRGGRAVAPVVRASALAWSARQARAMDGPAMLRAMLANCLAQILPNAAALALGSDDAEHVHQLRVGLRRLRSAARDMRPFAACLPAGWERAIRPVFEALGDVRDKHVRATLLAPRLRAAGAPVDGMGGPSEEDAKRLRELVRAHEFQAMLRQLQACAQVVDDDARDGAGSGFARLKRQLRRLARQVTRAARRFGKLSFTQQHRVRKRLKRLRYLAAFAAPAFDRDAVDAWMAKASRAQERLGKRIDLALAARDVAARVESDPGAGVAAGWLRARAEASTRRARKSLRRLRDARVFW